MPRKQPQPQVGSNENPEVTPQENPQVVSQEPPKVLEPIASNPASRKPIKVEKLPGGVTIETF